MRACADVQAFFVRHNRLVDNNTNYSLLDNKP